MRIVKKIKIEKPVHEVWKIWAEEFDQAGIWMAQVNHTLQKTSGTKAEGAPMIGRICNFTSNPNGPKAIEDILKYDPKHYKMDLRVLAENVPIPLKQNLFNSSLKKVSDHATEIQIEANIELKWKGYLLYPLIKKGFHKSYGELLEELKYYVENGSVHPRKQKKQHLTMT